jgi:hypothetical protein
MGETLWLFSFKTKMTYLKEWSILKMRAVGEATRCKVKVKVESGKSPDNNRAADDRLSRKSRKKKKKKNKERDFRSGSWDPGGGEEGGEGMRCAQGPPGGRSLPPSPLFLSPPPFPPKGGAHRPN